MDTKCKNKRSKVENKVVKYTIFIRWKELYGIQLRNVAAIAFPPYFRCRYFIMLPKNALDLIKSQTVRQIEILLILFLVSITGKIGKGWLISSGEQHCTDMLLRYLKGIPRTMLVHRSMIRKRYNDARSTLR